PRLVLPLVTRVKFFDSHRGVAIGHATAYYPSGVFVTQDGGETWQPLPADRAGGWLAGDFLDADTGAVAGPAGSFATLARRQIVRSPLATPSLHSFHAMRLVAPTGGWLVGDGGVVMATNDLGHSWQSPPNDLPDVATDHFDFHAVAMHGAHVWVAGSPGTRVFHSPDGGQSWQASTTGQQAPLRAIHFVDADFGWAVGDLGSILVTRDGGHSWQVQRSGAKRAALLAIFADANDVPLELIAEAGAADGYITAVDILHETTIDPEATAQLATSEQARAAMLLAGAATAESAWRFPLPPDELALAPADVLDSLNRANDGRAVDQIEKHLVRRLRMWRPDIVVTHHTTLEKSEPKAAVLAALIMRSVAAAADSTQYVELADELGLPPWQVKKVYGLLPGSSRGVESIVTGRFSPLLGTTLTDFVSSARQLLATDQSVSPDTYELELVMSQAVDTGGRGGLFGGIALAAASDARRPQSELPVNDLTQVRRLAARRRHLEELLERTEGNAAWIGQVGSLIDESNPNDGAELLIQLADGYRAAGRLNLAADTYYLLARRYPDHPFVERALVWLVQFYASSEAGHHGSSRGLTDVRQASFEEPDAMTPGVGLARDDRLRRAIQLTDYLKNVRPALYAEPSVRFAEVAAQRQLGFTNPAKRFYLTLRQLPADNPWRQAAETEEWLAKPTEIPPPKPIAAERRADDRPNLDGKLDERFW
ncbi:MAG: YCF48-related protein, partial [Pirellulales bacterium]